MAPDRADVVVMAGGFHGRTTTVVGFSDDPTARAGYGPFTPGFRTVPYGDLAALEAAVDEDTVAVLLEPVQGEAGVVVPPDGWLRGVRELTSRRGVLMVDDEVQSGLGAPAPPSRPSTRASSPTSTCSACAVGRAVVSLLRTGEHQERARVLGAHLHARLGELVGSGVTAVRGRGL